MAAEVHPIKVEMRGLPRDARGGPSFAATVHFRICSDAGAAARIAIEVERSESMEAAVADARRRLEMWAKGVADGARVRLLTQ
jgi:hypothetical protein